MTLQPASAGSQTGPPPRGRGWAFWLWLAGWLLLPAPLLADKTSPTLSLTPTVEAHRSHAPLQLDATINWTSQVILQGKLQLEYFVDDQLVHRWVSREFTLSGSQVTLPAVVPPVILLSEVSSLNIRGTIITKDRQFEQEFQIPYPADFKRVWVVGLVHPELSRVVSRNVADGLEDRFGWMKPYQLDRVLASRDLAQDFSCRIVPCEPADFPGAPLKLLAYDLLVVTREGFGQLTAEQLSALITWVEGGGSVHLMVERARTSQHQDLLRRLAVETPERPRLDFAQDGTASGRDGVNTLFTAPGIGRALISVGGEALSNEELNRLTLRLWRVRKTQIDRVLKPKEEEKKPRLEQEEAFPSRPQGFSQQLTRGFRVDAGNGADLQQLLKPQQVEGVPFRSVAMLLAACLLVVGPGEFLVLSALRRRKWTWLLFPATTILFAAGAIVMAQRYLGSTDFRNAVTFYDLSADGRIVRSSKFELLFTANQRDVQDELTGALATPLESRSAMDDPSSRLLIRGTLPTPYYVTPTESTASPVIATWSGQVPVRYQYTRTSKQWDPQLSRFTSLPVKPEKPLAEFADVARLTPDMLQNPAQVVANLSAARPQAIVTVWHREQQHTLGGINIYGDLTSAVANASFLLQRLDKDLSSPEANEVFEYVSQIATNASGNFDDLAIFDKSDPDAWLVTIIQPEKAGNYAIYRRLIRKE